MATCFMRLMFHGLDLCSSNVRPTSGGMGITFHGVRASPEPVVATGWLGRFVAAVPPSVPPGRGAHDEGALCGQKGRGRGRSQTRNTLTIGSSSNSGTGDDGDNDDDGDDSDYTLDNYSSVITFPFSTYYCFRVSIQTIAVVPSLPIPA